MHLFTRGMYALILPILSIIVSISYADYTANVINFGSLEIFSYETDNEIVVSDNSGETVWSGVLIKGDMQEILLNGDDVKYKVYNISATGLFTVLDGDGSNNPVSGYYVLDPSDRGISKELYTSFPNSTGKFIVFAYEDNTEVNLGTYLKYDDPNSSDPNDMIVEYPNISNTVVLNAGEHVAWPSWQLNRKKLRVTANKGVSALCATDSGYFVPASNGTFSGQQFYTYFSSAGGDDTFVFIGYNDNTTVTVTQEGEPFLDFTLSRGEIYEIDINEEDGRAKKYYTISSSENISTAVYNSNNRLVLAPGEDGSCFGSLDNFTILNMLNLDDNLHVISHCDNTTTTLYNVENGLESDGESGSFPVTLDAGEAEADEEGANIGCEQDYTYTLEVDSDDFVSVYYGYTDICYAEFVPLGFNVLKQTGFTDSLVSVYNGDSEIDLADETFPDDAADVVAGDVIDIVLDGIYSDTDTNCSAKLYLAPEMDIDINTALDSNYDHYNHSYYWNVGDMPFTISDGLSLTINEMAKPGTSIKFHLKYESDQHRKVYHYTLQVGKWTSGSAVDGVVYVDQNAIGYNSGTSWDNAFTDLNQALLYVNETAYNYDTIWVAKGAYAPMSYCNLKEDTFKLKSGVKVYGGFNGIETTLSDRNIVDNKTILTSNVYNVEDTETYTNNVVTITGTGAVWDGFLVRSSSEEAIYVSVTDGNGEAPVISKCAVVDSASYGILAESSSVKIVNCNICGNSDYGVWANGSGDITILNSFIHANGGGVSIEDSSFADIIQGNTIAYNAQSGLATNNSAQISSNIIWANNEQLSGPAIPEYCCIQGWFDTNIYSFPDTITDPNCNLQCDPLFAYRRNEVDPNVNDGFYDLHLSSNSPCINRGKTVAVDVTSETDIDGMGRIVDSYVDMGADEVSCDDTNSEYDIDRNGIINLKEFAGMATTWLLTSSTGWNEEYNFDAYGESEAKIDIADLTVLSEKWLWQPCYITSNTISELATVRATEVTEEIYELMLEYGISSNINDAILTANAGVTYNTNLLSSRTDIASLANATSELEEKSDNSISVVSIASMLIDDGLDKSATSGLLLTTKSGTSILDLRKDKDDPKVSKYAFTRDQSREALLTRKMLAESGNMTVEMQAISLNELYDFIVEIKDTLSTDEYMELTEGIEKAKKELLKQYKAGNN